MTDSVYVANASAYVEGWSNRRLVSLDAYSNVRKLTFSRGPGSSGSLSCSLQFRPSPHLPSQPSWARRLMKPELCWWSSKTTRAWEWEVTYREYVAFHGGLGTYLRRQASQRER